jgi:hypothetical protein
MQVPEHAINAVNAHHQQTGSTGAPNETLGLDKYQQAYTSPYQGINDGNTAQAGESGESFMPLHNFPGYYDTSGRPVDVMSQWENCHHHHSQL